jgi:hypothetical protein
MMMTEAFGQPILDYDSIPEREYENKEDLRGSEQDEVPLEDLEKEVDAKWGPSDREEYVRRVEEDRVDKERVHGELFVGTASIKELIEKIYSDYQDSMEKERAQNP